MSKIIDFPNKTSVSPEHLKILRNRLTDKREPGSVVRDFETLLDFIGQEGRCITAKSGVFPMRPLADLNQRMARPLKIALKRPSQKSYPHINGLYLLVRALGMAYTEGAGTKRRIVLNEATCESWKKLNLTERYFTLLETWLLRANPEILGERAGLLDSNIVTWARFFSGIPARGRKIGEDSKEETNLRYMPGLYALALMEMFGLVSVRHGAPRKGKGWRIESIRRTPFGDAMLEMLDDLLRRSQDLWILESDADMDDTFGSLQATVRPYFPNWQNNLEIPTHEFRDGTYVFKVSLSQGIWRRIAVSATMCLDDLSSEILDAFGFDHDHLYSFTFRNHLGVSTEVTHPYIDDNPPCADEFLIGDLPLRTGETMVYLYDFGDNWEFLAELEKTDPPNPRLKKPKVVDSWGDAPEQYHYWDEEDYFE